MNDMPESSQDEAVVVQTTTTVEEKIIAAHEIIEQLEIVIDDPAHIQRSESSKFHHNRAYLLNTYKLGCWLCAFAKAKYGAEPGTGGLEAHHVFEWSEWNDLDPDLVTQVLTTLQFNPMAGHPVGDPDDLPNLVILHESCHRGSPGKDVTCGAHYAPFPIWLAQGAAKMGVTITQDVEHRLGEVTAKRVHMKGHS